MADENNFEPQSENSNQQAPDWLLRLRKSNATLATYTQTFNDRLAALRSSLAKGDEPASRSLERLNEKLLDASTKAEAICCHGDIIQELALEILARASSGEDLKSNRIKDMIGLQNRHVAAIKRLTSSSVCELPWQYGAPD